MKLLKRIKELLIKDLGMIPYPFNDKGLKRNSYRFGCWNVFVWVLLSLIVVSVILMLTL